MNIGARARADTMIDWTRVVSMTERDYCTRLLLSCGQRGVLAWLRAIHMRSYTTFAVLDGLTYGSTRVLLYACVCVLGCCQSENEEVVCKLTANTHVHTEHKCMCNK